MRFRTFQSFFSMGPLSVIYAQGYISNNLLSHVEEIIFLKKIAIIMSTTVYMS